MISTLLALAAATVPVDYGADAKALDQFIIKNYAYEDHWPGGTLPNSGKLDLERARVHDRDSLLHYAEDRIASLADHHAITGSSFKDSWAVVPTYADLWVARRGGEWDRSRPAEQSSCSCGDCRRRPANGRRR